ncbi:TPA: hypothetical protein DIC20_02195 [Candidatus Dependentiae bacterium]|nr:MAG: hypothetical protein US03_C0006G0002 [candidate division TM6 bacterium GW2011_GWF2_36_131]KKQ03046.1 MAG: hypothetical protein US13_C0006G0002 [candidate division TM6 bacterium GW2011_GWE2_36_25]KKQ19613.1 MAG: hypothetical protein US32_C0007G0066 [candidate division TM6 bacterium GW2011_GWA2_36_9]HBR71128.1 hypothetical protein [Candidatus Dependentiae bacterium]HCU00495.1 hypothetical protein [Candidatus Dependentiae bacterium]
MYKKSALALTLLMSAPLVANQDCLLCSAKDNVVKGVKYVGEKVAPIAKTVGDKVSSGAQFIGTKALEAKNYVAGTATAAYLGTQINNANEWIKGNPYKSAGIAALGGALLSTWLVRKFYKQPKKQTVATQTRRPRRRFNRRHVRHNGRPAIVKVAGTQPIK